MAHLLLRHRVIPDFDTLTVYRKNGGLASFKNAVTKMKPTEVTDIVKNSGLRGRGGAEFDYCSFDIDRQRGFCDVRLGAELANRDAFREIAEYAIGRYYSACILFSYWGNTFCVGCWRIDWRKLVTQIRKL